MHIPRHSCCCCCWKRIIAPEPSPLGHKDSDFPIHPPFGYRHTSCWVHRRVLWFGRHVQVRSDHPIRMLHADRRYDRDGSGEGANVGCVHPYATSTRRGAACGARAADCLGGPQELQEPKECLRDSNFKRAQCQQHHSAPPSPSQNPASGLCVLLHERPRV